MHSFVSTYSSELCFRYVWIPLLIACVLGLLGLFLNRPLFTFISAVFSGTAIYNWPYLDTRRAVIRMTAAGLDIDGIGRIAWEDVQSVQLVAPTRKPRADLEDNVIRITLNRSDLEAANPRADMYHSKWMRSFITPTDSNQIEIPPRHLSDSQSQIASAFAWFIHSTNQP